MEMNPLKVKALVATPIQKAWDCYTQPEHIKQWNFADESWQCPSASNDMVVGGKYFARMEAKDGSMGFDFEAIYQEVEAPHSLAYVLTDGRQVRTTFEEQEGGTLLSTVFDPDQEAPLEMQQAGWQAILNNFKKHTEAH